MPAMASRRREQALRDDTIFVLRIEDTEPSLPQTKPPPRRSRRRQQQQQQQQQEILLRITCSFNLNEKIPLAKVEVSHQMSPLDGITRSSTCVRTSVSGDESQRRQKVTNDNRSSVSTGEKPKSRYCSERDPDG
jgi:hypothetical protein